MINAKIKILIVEDQLTDVELAIRELSKYGMQFEYKHVYEKAEFIIQLDEFSPDVILCDYSMPSFDGMTALRLAREKYPTIPFIIYTGSINEVTAVKCIKEGANDYIIKQYKTRLPLSIKSAIDQSIILKEKIRAENELRESEEKYRALSENALDIVYRFSFSPIPNFDYVSPSLQKIMGITPAELYNNYKLGLILLNLEEKDFEDLNNIKTNYKSSLTHKYVKDNNTIVFIETQNEIKFEGDVPSFIQGSARDVTKQVNFQIQLKNSEESYKLLFENNPNSMFVYDNNTNRIIDVNDTAVNEFQYSKDEFLNNKINFILSDNSDECFSLLSNTQFDKLNSKKLLKKNGEIFYGDITIHSINYKGTEAKIALISDVTQKVIAEQKLIEAKINAEKADKIKTNFLAQMSHEIRTPINVIMNFVGLLKDIVKVDDENEFSIKTAFNAISKANMRIIRTIDLILNMSEIQVGAYKPHIQELNLFSDIIEKILPDFQNEISEKKLNFNFNCMTDDDSFLGDAYSITQIFINLIDNAIKYTKEGSVIIDAYCNSDKLIVEISDTGIGISEDYMVNLFKPFRQEEEGYTRKYEGNGLGLALVKRYCELNNCEISVTSKKGVGTKFKLSFIKNKK
jgi:PAS domain S-box-containing protein